MKRNNLVNKKGQTGGIITGLVFGITSLIIGVIIAYVIINTLTSAHLVATGSAGDNVSQVLVGNLTEGIGNVASKIPTILLVAAIVLILGVLALLVGMWQRMRMGGAEGVGGI